MAVRQKKKVQRNDAQGDLSVPGRRGSYICSNEAADI